MSILAAPGMAVACREFSIIQGRPWGLRWHDCPGEKKEKKEKFLFVAPTADE
ncbi:hypothetical protein [Desulfuromonas carbonis]